MKIEEEGLSITAERRDGSIIYTRDHNGERVEKVVFTTSDTITISPVEPVNIPKEITPFLLVELERPMAIEPGAKGKCYLKFPIEFGVFVTKGKEHETLDILTLTSSKFTLYGSVETGKICKYWKSGISSKIPSVDMIREGVLRLDFINKTDQWIDVSKVVFNAYGMKIYYGSSFVSIVAEIQILSDLEADISFSNKAVKKGMKKALELYTLTKFQLIPLKFTMREGF